MTASYFKYWGKARKNSSQQGPSYHLLPYHCLDVAAVASVWWDNSCAVRNSFQWQQTKGTSLDQLKAWMLFFMALHDYGKFDIRFQCKALSVWKKLQTSFNEESQIPTIHDCKKYDHGSAGLHWFYEDRNQENDISGGLSLIEIINLTETSLPKNTELWIKAVTGHHGFVYPENDLPKTPLPSTISTKIGIQDKKARLGWLKELETLFLKPVSLSFESTPPQPSPLLAGFCSVADWLGSLSDHKNFCYKEQATDDLSAYFARKVEKDAKRVFELSGIHGTIKPYKGVNVLLKPDDKPRQLQTLVDELPDKPGLAVVEAPTGSGKTEMALAYAWRLIAAHHADSIVFAMPTQATANAMFKRLKKLATKLFEDRPNLLLAHGNARFNTDFLTLQQAGKTVQENEEAWAQCSKWLRSRKRIFLGQIGICTVDQVLMSVLPVKHRFVRGFGVGRSILIVDEIHAYDAYMYGLLEAVLDAQRKTGASCILLSATLPQKLKDRLIKACNKLHEGSYSYSPYPLISWSDGNQTKSLPFTLPNSEHPPVRHVQFELRENDDSFPSAALCQSIIEAARQGAQVAIVCNLVDIAQQLAQQLRKQTDINVDIFHARYCLTDRQKKENKVLEHFGKQGRREAGRVLVATQVIEQSLDVDFDWLITQLCPIDLLFQRMGRLHRHERLRPTGFTKPLCTILLPVGNDYGLHGLIYSNPRVMWRTAFKLRELKKKIIKFPAAYREWIETVYRENPWGNEPEEIEDNFRKFEEDRHIKQGLAKQMLSWANNAALNDGDERIRAVTRDGEFSLSVVPYLDTPSGKQLLDSQVLENLDEGKQAETLAMNTVRVPYSWRRCLPDSDQEGYIWLLMQKEGEYWRTKDTCFSYHSEWGMRREDNNTA